MGIISERPKRWLIFDRIADRFMQIFVIACLWIIFSITGLLLWGFKSKSLTYWIIAIIVFPFLLILGEGAVELFRKVKPVRQARESVEAATKEKSFSGLRVLYLLVETLILFGLFSALWSLGSTILGK